MKYKALSKVRLIYLVLALMLLMVSLVPTAVAQEPEEEGDVNAAFTFHGPAEFVPQNLLLDTVFGGTTDLVINDIEDVHAARLFVDFPLLLSGFCPLAVAAVDPGDLLDGLVRGGLGDYELYWGVFPGTADADFDAAVPIPAGYNRLYIDVVLFAATAPLQGNGSLAQITWGVGACLIGPPTPAQFLFWQGAQFTDRDGNEILPCSDLGVGCNRGLPVFPTNGAIAIEGADQVIRAQVSSEGGKPSGVAPAYVVTSIGPGGGICPLDANPIDDQWECPAIAAVELTAARPGYCGATTFPAVVLPGTNQPNTTLLAGEIPLISPGVIDIADIANIAGLLGTADAVRDYNNNGLVDIGDLALAAKNYGTACPQPW